MSSRSSICPSVMLGHSFLPAVLLLCLAGQSLQGGKRGVWDQREKGGKATDSRLHGGSSHRGVFLVVNIQLVFYLCAMQCQSTHTRTFEGALSAPLNTLSDTIIQYLICNEKVPGRARYMRGVMTLMKDRNVREHWSVK